MAKKNSKQAFVNAMQAKGGVRYFDLGGGVTAPTLSPQPTTQTPAAGTLGAGAAANPTLAMTNPIGTAGQTASGIAADFTAQNGFQAQLAPTTQFNYAPTANQAVSQSLAGYGQQQGNISNEQALASQLVAQGNGQGPNPAQAQLAQNTQANIASQAALQAGQRGAASNVGLMARQIGQQGAATQQGATGEAATLQAQQELASQQGAAALQGQIGNQITNQQSVNNQLAGTAIGANNTQNANLISNYGMAQGLNQSTAQSNANATNQTLGGLLSGAGSIAALLADGGKVEDAPVAQMPPHVQDYAEGGPVSWAGQFLNSSPSVQAEAAPSTGEVAPMLQAPKASGVGVQFNMPGKKKQDAQPQQGSAQTVTGVSDTPGAQAMAGGQGENTQPDPTALQSDATMVAAKGGKVPAMVSPGERYLPPKEVAKVASGKKSPMKAGEAIKGKAKVKGDSLKNDTVPKTLDSGGIVLPRSVTQHPDAAHKAYEFVRQIQAKQGLKRK
jgi:hypothetical protein